VGVSPRSSDEVLHVEERATDPVVVELRVNKPGPDWVRVIVPLVPNTPGWMYGMVDEEGHSPQSEESSYSDYSAATDPRFETRVPPNGYVAWRLDLKVNHRRPGKYRVYLDVIVGAPSERRHAVLSSDTTTVVVRPS